MPEPGKLLASDTDTPLFPPATRPVSSSQPPTLSLPTLAFYTLYILSRARLRLVAFSLCPSYATWHTSVKLATRTC